MVYYLPACRGLFHTPDEVHEHRLTCATPANNSQDLPFGNLKRNILEYPRAIKIHAEVVDRDQWSLHSTLIPNVILVTYYLLYDASQSSQSKRPVNVSSFCTMVITSLTFFTT
jgi:hypothetical protein